MLADAGIVRNRLKISVTIQNAKAFLAVKKEFGSFDRYIWHYVGGRPKQNRRRSMKSVPTRTAGRNQFVVMTFGTALRWSKDATSSCIANVFSFAQRNGDSFTVKSCRTRKHNQVKISKVP